MYKKHDLRFKKTFKRYPLCKFIVFASVLLCLAIVAFVSVTRDQWRINIRKRVDFIYSVDAERKEYDGQRLRDEASLVYLDNTGYKIAEEQLNYETRLPRNKARQNLSDFNNGTFKNRYSTIEHDPTIDENMVPQSFKFVLNKKKRLDRPIECTIESPIKKIAFLRIHRTGSHTISNIFYRYGDHNNLFFGLPNGPAFQYYWPLRFHHSHIAKDLLMKNTPDFIINVARNSKNNIQTLIASETYNIAIVRDPVEHFQSIYEYVDISYFMQSITNETDYFTEFLKDPEKNILKILNSTQLFEPVFHLLKNGQLFDFGYEHDDYQDPLKMPYIIRELDEQLDFVLVSEYMDESLVVLQRLLCWQLSDMVYIKQRMRRNRDKVSNENRAVILKWNKEDVILHNHFNKTLWNLIQQQDDTFWKDVNKLRELVDASLEECVEDYAKFPSYTSYKEKQGTNTRNNPTNARNNQTNARNAINKAVNTTAPTVPSETFEIRHTLRKDVNTENERLCKKLLFSEKDYIKLLKAKQKQFIKENNDVVMSSKYITNLTQGHFYYLASSVTKTTSNDTGDIAVNEFVEKEDENEEPKEIILGSQ